MCSHAGRAGLLLVAPQAWRPRNCIKLAAMWPDAFSFLLLELPWGWKSADRCCGVSVSCNSFERGGRGGEAPEPLRSEITVRQWALCGTCLGLICKSPCSVMPSLSATYSVGTEFVPNCAPSCLTALLAWQPSAVFSLSRILNVIFCPIPGKLRISPPKSLEKSPFRGDMIPHAIDYRVDTPELESLDPFPSCSLLP